MHWAQKYLLKTSDIDDCADLVEIVQEQEFDRIIRLPRREETVRGRDRQVRDLRADFADPIGADELVDGDLVLMRATARARSVGHHIGVWLHPDGQLPFVLHHLAHAGTRLTAIHRLHGFGLEIAGYYRLKDD